MIEDCLLELNYFCNKTETMCSKHDFTIVRFILTKLITLQIAKLERNVPFKVTGKGNIVRHKELM